MPMPGSPLVADAELHAGRRHGLRDDSISRTWHRGFRRTRLLALAAATICANGAYGRAQDHGLISLRASAEAGGSRKALCRRRCGLAR
jgi:hypothetical protein